MLIFGGSFTSNLRFNDTYILKTSKDFFIFWKSEMNKKYNVYLINNSIHLNKGGIVGEEEDFVLIRFTKIFI